MAEGGDIATTHSSSGAMVACMQVREIERRATWVFGVEVVRGAELVAWGVRLRLNEVGGMPDLGLNFKNWRIKLNLLKI